MATTVTFYVNTASTPGGDGTTNGTVGATRAFAALADAEAALQRSLVASDEVLIIECSGATADTSAVSFSGWTVDATRYVEVRGNNTTGKWDTSKYRLQVTGAAPTNLTISGCYFSRWKNLQFEQIRTGTSTAQSLVVRVSAFAGTNNVDVRFDACIVKADTHAATITGNTHGFSLRHAGSGQNVYVTNCVSKVVNPNGGTDSAFNLLQTASSSRTYIYNCTGYGDGNDFSISSGSAGTATLKNCVAANAGFASLANALAVTHLASADASATGTGAITSATFTFVDAANLDFHLAAGDASGAKTGGTNLTSDASFPFSTDIDGHTRPGGATAWSMGADEYNSGGASGIDATFSGTIPLTASAAGVVDDNAVLIGTIPLGLTGAGSVELRAALAGVVPLSLTAVGVTTEGGNITAVLTGTIPLSLATSASVAVPATLDGFIPLGLSAHGAITQRADLVATIPLTASAAASAESRGVLTATIPLSLAGTALTSEQDEVSAVLNGVIPLGFSGEAVTTLAAHGAWLKQRERARVFVEAAEAAMQDAPDGVSVVQKKRTPRRSPVEMPVPSEFVQDDEEAFALLYATFTSMF